MGGQHQVGSLALDDVGLLVLGWDNNGVAENRGEPIDLGTKLDLDRLALLKLNGSLLLVRLQGGVRSDIGAGRDGGRVSKSCATMVSAGPTCRSRAWRASRGELVTLGDLLSTPDLGDLLLEQLVALAADVGDLLAGNAEILDSSEDLLGDLGRGLVLGQGIRIVKGVICDVRSARGPGRP